MHKYLSAERSSPLNVETKPRFSVYPTSHLCVVFHFLIFYYFQVATKNFNTIPKHRSRCVACGCPRVCCVRNFIFLWIALFVLLQGGPLAVLIIDLMCIKSEGATIHKYVQNNFYTRKPFSWVPTARLVIDVWVTSPYHMGSPPYQAVWKPLPTTWTCLNLFSLGPLPPHEYTNRQTWLNILPSCKVHVRVVKIVPLDEIIFPPTLRPTP